MKRKGTMVIRALSKMRKWLCKTDNISYEYQKYVIHIYMSIHQERKREDAREEERKKYICIS